MSPNVQSAHPGRKSPDITLVLSRIEKEILDGGDESGCRKILGRENLWKQADVSNRLRWALLAQMAGDMETARNVYAHIHRTDPDDDRAWQGHLELLLILDRRDEAAKVLAACRAHVGRTTYRRLKKRCMIPGASSDDADVAAASVPFERLRRRQSAVERYMALFSGRKECFARQWTDRAEGKQGYVPVRRPLEYADVSDHLKGIRTYGIYILRSDATVRTAVIDMDLRKPFRKSRLTAVEKGLIRRERQWAVSRIRELGEQAGLKPLVEFSGGKGFHFWFFFNSPVAAAEVKAVLDAVVHALAGDLSAFSLEVFPKQTRLTGKGLGNLVKLPLGVHRLTGKRSFFIECTDRSVDAQLDFLSRVEAVKWPGRAPMPTESGKKKVLIHPRWEKWAEQYPELASLERRCPPLAQVIAACRNGQNVSFREEKVLFQTIGFLPRAKTLMHHLAALMPDYNPHRVDYRLSRLRGTPIGCRRIHSLLNFTGDRCVFENSGEYDHPLLHLDHWRNNPSGKAEKAENLAAALENLKLAVARVERFLK